MVTSQYERVVAEPALDRRRLEANGCKLIQRREIRTVASPANAQPVDEFLIAILVSGLDVIEQPAPLAHHFEQAAP
jgi:hypothetical protein